MPAICFRSHHRLYYVERVAQAWGSATWTGCKPRCIPRKVIDHRLGEYRSKSHHYGGKPNDAWHCAALKRMLDRKHTDYNDSIRNKRRKQHEHQSSSSDRAVAVLGLVAFGLLGARAAQALTADEEAVAKRLEAFRTAQFAADAKAFDGLCAAELSYSHSDGRVEDKAIFIKNATAGKSKFLSLEYQEPSIRVVGDVAIVRFHWLGESETIADGKKNSTNLHILMTWQKQVRTGNR